MFFFQTNLKTSKPPTSLRSKSHKTWNKESRQNLVKIFYLYNVKMGQFTPSPPLSLRTNFTMTVNWDSTCNINKLYIDV